MGTPLRPRTGRLSHPLAARAQVLAARQPHRQCLWRPEPGLLLCGDGSLVTPPLQPLKWTLVIAGRSPADGTRYAVSMGSLGFETPVSAWQYELLAMSSQRTGDLRNHN